MTMQGFLDQGMDANSFTRLRDLKPRLLRLAHPEEAGHVNR